MGVTAQVFSVLVLSIHARGSHVTLLAGVVEECPCARWESQGYTLSWSIEDPVQSPEQSHQDGDSSQIPSLAWTRVLELPACADW